MKKKWVALIAAAGTLLCAAAVAVAIYALRDLREIRIDFLPFKTAYATDESFDPTGLVVTAVYKDEVEQTLNSADYSVKVPNMSKVGSEEAVVVKYKGCTAKFSITVAEAPAVTGIRLDTSGLNYYITKDSDYTKANSGLIVYASYSDGTERVVSDYTTTKADTAMTGVQDITVTYGEFSQTYSIAVMYNVHFVPVDPNSTESQFLLIENQTDMWSPPDSSVYNRSADGNKTSDSENIGAYFTYSLNLHSAMSDAVLVLATRYQTKVEVSFDNIHYQVVDLPLMGSAIDVRKLDLSVLLDGKNGNLSFADNRGLLFVRFSDPTMGDGFGADLFKFDLYYNLVDTAAYQAPSGYYSDSRDLYFEVGTQSEKDYLYNESGSAVGNSDKFGDHRFTNTSDAYFTYAVDFGSQLQYLTVQTVMQGQSRVEVSLDGVNWQTIADYKTYASYGKFTYLINFLLDGKNGNLDFTTNTGKLYIRFSDSDNDGLFGADVFNVLFKYTLKDASNETSPVGLQYNPAAEFSTDYALTFKPYSSEESAFLYKERNTNPGSDSEGSYRFIDGKNSSFTYGIDVGSKISEGYIQVQIGQMYQKIEVSFDGVNWDAVRNVTSPGGAETVTIRLGETAGFSSNTGKLYVRFSGSDGYTGAFGITLYKFAFYYNLRDSGQYREPRAINSNDHQLVIQPLTNSESAFLYEESGTNQMTDGAGTFRFIDGTGSSFTYAINVGSSMSMGSLTLKIGQMYQKIEVSFDGTNWTTLLDNGNGSGVQTVDFSLNSVSGFSGNTGKLYVRFSGGSGYTGSFGLTLYRFVLDYELSSDALYTAPTGITAPQSDNHTLSITPFSGDESTYLYSEKSTGDMTDSAGRFRFIDATDSSFVYASDMGSPLSKATLTVKTGQMYQKIEVSFDGSSWVELLNTMNTDGVKTRSFDLSSAVGFSANTGKVFVRFSGADGYTGSFGICLYSYSLIYQLADESRYTVPVAVSQPEPSSHTLSITPFTTDEATYLYSEKSTGDMTDSEGRFRFINAADSSFVYASDMGSPLSTATLTVKTNQMYQKIEVSFDGSSWVELLNTVNTDGVKTRTFDLSSATGFSTNTGKVFVRFSGADGYTGSFGICLYSYSLSYQLTDESRYTAPVAVSQPEPSTYTLAFSPFTPDETTYLYSESSTGDMTDSEGRFRFVNAADSSFVYASDMGSPLSKGTLTVKTGQMYQKIEVSFDGTNWTALLSTVNTDGVKTRTFDLSTATGFSTNTGKVFVRFSGADGYTGSFGICVYSYSLSYQLADDSLYTAPAAVSQPEPSTYTLAFSPITSDEATYLYSEKGTGDMTDSEGRFRFINAADSSFVYASDMGSVLSAATLTVKTGQMYQKIEVSFDGSSWVELLNTVNTDGVKTRTFDLSSATGFSANTGKVYVRFSGADGYTGSFGICVYAYSLSYQLADESRYTTPVAVPQREPSTYTLALSPFTAEETTYLYSESSTGDMTDSEGRFRFINAADSSFVYASDMGSALSAATLTVKTGQMYQKIEVSFDGTSWAALLNTVNTDGIKERTFDLTTVTGFSANTGKVYVRFSGADGYTGSFGICVYAYSLSYQLADESRYTAPVAVPQREPSTYTLALSPFTAEETTYLYSESSTGDMTDSEGRFRFINAADSSFVYASDMGSSLSKATLTVKTGQMYQKIEVSFDGTSWVELLNTVNTDGIKERTFDLSTVTGFSANTGKVYVRFSGGDGYTGSFGICVYSYSLSYQLTDESLYSAPKGID